MCVCVCWRGRGALRRNFAVNGIARVATAATAAAAAAAAVLLLLLLWWWEGWAKLKASMICVKEKFVERKYAHNRHTRTYMYIKRTRGSAERACKVGLCFAFSPFLSTGTPSLKCWPSLIQPPQAGKKANSSISFLPLDPSRQSRRKNKKENSRQAVSPTMHTNTYTHKQTHTHTHTHIYIYIYISAGP